MFKYLWVSYVVTVTMLFSYIYIFGWIPKLQNNKKTTLFRIKCKLKIFEITNVNENKV